MRPVQIKKDIYWVGAVDWNVRSFHGHTYTTQRGTTYNAYLIKDDKVALVDTVYGPFSGEMIDRIKEIVDPAKIDYVIANHVETDHSGGLGAILKLCPSVKVLGTGKCKDGLHRNYYLDMDFEVVKTGDKLSLGNRTLTFLEAPMIHWPDSMFTYCPEEQLLLPNDAFGQHYATSSRFDDEVDQAELMDEALKYYANILWPLGSVISKKLQEVQGLNIPINMIAPSHGIIWRKDPMKIVNAYAAWTKQQTRPKVVMVYETMWGSTEKMARKIAEGIIDTGLDVKVFDVNQADRTEIIKQMYDAKGYLIGSGTHDNDMLPAIGGFLVFLRGLKPKDRIAATFGSYGWGGGATKAIEASLKEAGIEIAQPTLGVQYAPDVQQSGSCYEWGKAFAQKIK
jgi:flavorubredoxin